MSSKYINDSAYATSGYTLNGTNTSVIIGPSGLIGGPGLSSDVSANFTIANKGTVTGTAVGIALQQAGTVTNSGAHALIQGYYYGVRFKAGSGTVTNTGTIAASSTAPRAAGVLLSAGGTVTNTGHGAVIEGYDGVNIGASGLVTNSGTIESLGAGNVGDIEANKAGVEFYSGTLDNSGTIVSTGSDSKSFGAYFASYGVVNGIVNNNIVNNIGTASLIEGGLDGVDIAYRGTVANAGTIEGTGLGVGVGINLQHGGLVTNKAGALIEGAGYGVSVETVSGVVTNTGTISGGTYSPRGASYGGTYYVDASGSGGGIRLSAGGSVTNTGPLAVVYGYQAVEINGPGSVTNSGDIDGILNGVYMASGTLANSGTVSASLGVGVYFSSAAVVNNTGHGSLIEGNSGGVYIRGVGTVTNSGRIESGNTAVDLLRGGTVTNSGTIKGDGVNVDSDGVYLHVGGLVTNKAGALIEGARIGVLAAGGTVSNSGTIASTAGAGGTAVDFTSSDGLFVNESGSKLIGKAIGGGGTMELAGVNGVIAGIGTGFTGFTTIRELAAASWTFKGDNTILTGQALSIDGTASATFVKGATLTLGDAGGGMGTLNIQANAVFNVDAGAGIAVATGGKGAIHNAGTLEKSAGVGVSTIASAIGNSGTIGVAAGTLDLMGAVTGKGTESIGKGTKLQFDAAVAAAQTVTFVDTTGGDLILNDPAGMGLSFKGLVSGFGGQDKLDLRSFAFTGKPTVKFLQNGKQGTLTVIDGKNVARIALFGQYVAAGFQLADDGAGGTVITYTPPAEAAALAPPHHA
jgi:hypothetical protein